MNKRLIIFTLLVSVPLFLTVILQARKNEGIADRNTDTAESITNSYSSSTGETVTSPDRIQRTEAILLNKKQQSPELIFYSLTSYAQTDELINQLLADGREEDAKNLEEIANKECYKVNTDNFFVYRGKESEGYQLLKEFCTGYTEGYDKQKYDVAIEESFKRSSEIQERVTSDLADGLEQGDVESALMKAIHDANDPFELNAVAVGNGIFIALANQYQYTFEQNTNVLLDINEQAISNAISIFSCNKFRHCNKGGIEYIGYCFAFGDICKNYTNTVDMLYATLSPIRTQKMEVVLSAIYNYR